MKPVNQTTQPPGVDAASAGSRTGGAPGARSHALPAASRAARAVPANGARGSSLPGGGSPSDDRRRLGRRLASAAVLMAMMVSLLVAVPPLRRVADQIGRMGPGWLLLAVVLEVASCCSFVVVFRLFFDRVPRVTAQPLAWTEMGAGALLPGGGIGSLAVGGWLLHQAGMSRRRILERSSGLFFLTSAASVGAMVAAGGLLLTSAVSGPHDLLRAGAPILAGIAVTGAVLAVPAARQRSHQAAKHRWLGDLIDGIDTAVHALRRPTWRLLGAAGYLGFDIAVLWAAFAATGRPPPVAALALAYIIGYLTNLLPIPGSIGVLDGGLTAALIAYGAHATQAAAAVLVYHAIAFWIPSLGGLWGYALLNRRLTHCAAAIDGAAASVALIERPQRADRAVRGAAATARGSA